MRKEVLDLPHMVGKNRRGQTLRHAVVQRQRLVHLGDCLGWGGIRRSVADDVQDRREGLVLDDLVFVASLRHTRGDVMAARVIIAAEALAAT